MQLLAMLLWFGDAGGEGGGRILRSNGRVTTKLISKLRDTLFLNDFFVRN